VVGSNSAVSAGSGNMVSDNGNSAGAHDSALADNGDEVSDDDHNEVSDGDTEVASDGDPADNPAGPPPSVLDLPDGRGSLDMASPAPVARAFPFLTLPPPLAGSSTSPSLAPLPSSLVPLSFLLNPESPSLGSDITPLSFVDPSLLSLDDWGYLDPPPGMLDFGAFLSDSFQ